MNFTDIFINHGYVNNRWLQRYLKFVHLFNTTESANTHNHHILPKSLFKEFKSFTKYPENKSIITHRAHLIAHYLLARAIGGEMWYAYNNMNAFNVRMSSRLYAYGQEQLSLLQSIRQKKWLKTNDHPKGMLGKKHSIESKQKIGEYGKWKIHSDEIKHRLSENWKNKSESDKLEIINKISNSKIGQRHSDETKKILSDKANERYSNGFKIEKTVEQIEKSRKTLREFYKNHGHHTKGKSYEEIMGVEKAEALKKWKRENNPMHDKSSRDKISKSNTGKKRSEETKYKLSKLVPITNGTENKRLDPNLLSEYLDKGWWKGYTKKDEEKFSCKYCGVLTNRGNLNRWHDENCKSKQIVI